jgi:hypothetical protein
MFASQVPEQQRCEDWGKQNSLEELGTSVSPSLAGLLTESRPGHPQHTDLQRRLFSYHPRSQRRWLLTPLDRISSVQSRGFVGG